MKRQMIFSSIDLRWRRIVAISAILVAGMLLLTIMGQQTRPIQVPPEVVDPPSAFQAPAAFEQANDIAVLRAVLKRSCEAGSPVVLDSKPSDENQSRSSRSFENFPDELACARVEIVDSRKLKDLFSRPYHGRKNTTLVGGWGNFYAAYPDATGVITLSLPTYPSLTSAVVKLGRTCSYRCGAGWEIHLTNIKGEWVVRDIRSTWIT
ncbi:hypothetical protein [uncultured Stenotrophomonas sp.]|uniref:hypothetical protein n=1 Tax=uncultured Stenotrophomonas sp. TaxID=165438 RepID=UPI0028E5AEF6|nr:hypothetical protein [uncultured Stenotrophomonas sp.]